jgi:hypothetical protein
VSVDRIVIGGDVVPGPLPVETIERNGRSATGPCFVRGNGDRWVVDKFDTPGSMSEGDERPGRPWAAGPPMRSTGATVTCSRRLQGATRRRGPLCRSTSAARETAKPLFRPQDAELGHRCVS